MQALCIIDQSWHARRWDLCRTVKAMQICVHITYEDCREHVCRQTKLKPQHFMQSIILDMSRKKRSYGHSSELWTVVSLLTSIIFPRCIEWSISSSFSFMSFSSLSWVSVSFADSFSWVCLSLRSNSVGKKCVRCYSSVQLHKLTQKYSIFLI